VPEGRGKNEGKWIKDRGRQEEKKWGGGKVCGERRGGEVGRCRG